MQLGCTIKPLPILPHHLSSTPALRPSNFFQLKGALVAADARGSTLGTRLSFAILEISFPGTRQRFYLSMRQYCPPEPRTRSGRVPRTWCRARFSFLCFHARISSILPSTNRARSRLSFGGMGGSLVIKFVKPTKVFCSWAPHQGCVSHFLPSQAESLIWAAAEGILRGNESRFSGFGSKSTLLLIDSYL